MILYPAIDLLGGRVVRLHRGDYGASTDYGDDPVAVALSFVEQGARWVHVVDLDAARSGDPVNRGVIAEVTGALANRARVQTGGGVRRVEDARALADAGVARVVMGSAAVSDPSLVEQVAAVVPVAVGLDHRDGVVAVHGWTSSSGRTVWDLLDAFPAAEAFVITDIARDGTMAGPDVEGLARAAARSTVPVVASGGVGGADDLVALASVEGLAGVIVGKALYEGAFTVRDALALVGDTEGGTR